MGLKNEKQGVCFVRFSLLMFQNTKKNSGKCAYLADFSPKTDKKSTRICPGWSKKGYTLF